MATHSSILAWRVPWTEEPGGLQIAKSWTRLSNFTSLCSVTCINCQFCVTPVHFNHSTYSWEQIKFHLVDNASLNVQLLQKEIFETFSKHLPSSPNLETLAKQIIWARPTRIVSKYYPQHRV